MPSGLVAAARLTILLAARPAGSGVAGGRARKIRSIALLYATGWTLMGPAPGVAGWLVAGITTLVVWRTRVPMMALIAAGAALGALGLF